MARRLRLPGGGEGGGGPAACAELRDVVETSRRKGYEAGQARGRTAGSGAAPEDHRRRQRLSWPGWTGRLPSSAWRSPRNCSADFDQAELVARLAQQALQSFQHERDVTITVAPALGRPGRRARCSSHSGNGALKIVVLADPRLDVQQMRPRQRRGRRRCGPRHAAVGDPRGAARRPARRPGILPHERACAVGSRRAHPSACASGRSTSETRPVRGRDSKDHRHHRACDRADGAGSANSATSEIPFRARPCRRRWWASKTRRPS